MKKIAILLILLFSTLYGEDIEFNNYKIEISVKKCEMYFYGIDENKEKTLIQTYKVATPKKTEIYPKNEGKILKVDLNPWWYPTEITKAEFKKKKKINLADAIPPGDKNNYMGTFKIHLSMCTKEKGCVYRIHGNVDESSIGKRSSGGCIRMYNEEGKDFAQEVKIILDEGKDIFVQYM